jgi:uncharacterized protein DUF695
MSHLDGSWEALTRTYEGFPLFLRRPIGLDFDLLSLKFKVRLVLTHTFNFSRFDGAPEPAYNDGLGAFDIFVSRYFEPTAEGQIVLIETFGGRRNYYFYVASSVDPQSVLADLRTRYPTTRLEIQIAGDPGWGFIRQYTKEHLSGA